MHAFGAKLMMALFLEGIKSMSKDSKNLDKDFYFVSF